MTGIPGKDSRGILAAISPHLQFGRPAGLLPQSSWARGIVRGHPSLAVQFRAYSTESRGHNLTR